MSVAGWDDEDSLNDDLTTATVVAFPVATLLLWRKRRRAARIGERPRYGGSFIRRAANCP